MYVSVGGLSMELRASYMLGIYPIINPYPSTFLLKLSVSDSPHLQENGLLGVILYRIPLARSHLLQGATSYMPVFKLLNFCKHGSLQALL